MTFTVLKIVFAALLCVPMAITACRLFMRLMDEYIQINRAKQEQKEREKKALAQQKRRRGYYR